MAAIPQCNSGLVLLVELTIDKRDLLDLFSESTIWLNAVYFSRWATCTAGEVSLNGDITADGCDGCWVQELHLGWAEWIFDGPLHIPGMQLRRQRPGSGVGLGPVCGKSNILVGAEARDLVQEAQSLC